MDKFKTSRLDKKAQWKKFLILAGIVGVIIIGLVFFFLNFSPIKIVSPKDFAVTTSPVHVVIKYQLVPTDADLRVFDSSNNLVLQRSFTLPSNIGTFDWALTLSPGTYRVRVQAGTEFSAFVTPDTHFTIK